MIRAGGAGVSTVSVIAAAGLVCLPVPVCEGPSLLHLLRSRSRGRTSLTRLTAAAHRRMKPGMCRLSDCHASSGCVTLLPRQAYSVPELNRCLGAENAMSVPLDQRSVRASLRSVTPGFGGVPTNSRAPALYAGQDVNSCKEEQRGQKLDSSQVTSGRFMLIHLATGTFTLTSQTCVGSLLPSEDGSIVALLGLEPSFVD
jgi:hypothetical protein